MLLERRLKRQRTREANRAAKETAVEEEPEAQAATESRDARAERRAQAKHAGSRAVAMRAAAEGDLNITPTERQEIDDLISCKHKDQQYKQQRKEAYQTSSAGVLALISACGLFLAVDELYGAESLSQVRRATPSCPAPPPRLSSDSAPSPSHQVHLFLCKIFFRWKLPVPKVLVYDDACHLLAFLMNRVDRAEQFGYSKFAWWLLKYKAVKLVVDRFHWRNHKNNPFCKRWVDPSKCEELGPRTNTEAAEQVWAPSRIHAPPARVPSRARAPPLSPHPRSPIAVLRVAGAQQARVPAHEPGALPLHDAALDGQAQPLPLQ